MGFIRKRSNGTLAYVFMWKGQRHTKNLGTTDEKEAENLRQDADEQLNRIRKGKSALASSYDRFHRVAEMLQEAQDAELLRFTFEFEKDQQAAYLYTPPMPEEWKDKRTQFRELLDLPMGEYERLKLTANSVRREPDELPIQTRSMLGTMYALAQEIAVPDDHLNKCQPATAPAAEDEQAAPRWLRVRHSRLPQPGAFVQVSCRGYWFYVDDSDWSSKRTVSLLTYLCSLQSTAKEQTGPLLTVPAGR